MRTGKKSQFKFSWETCAPHKCVAKPVVGLTASGEKFGFCEECNRIVYYK